ncbi:MAG TPA: helix-turn-helix transcriptional regulator [Cyclobacteriaceae bacterium]|nr:helix-turn-helix transcriptional regulator [Cyclobacteriaceae bacterium]
MYFLDTKMHLVTFSITAFEVVILFFQVIYFLQRTNDVRRLLYLILLVLIILYNITSGFLPDENFPLPIALQNVMAYLVAFSTSMYFVYYFYRAFNLRRLRFFATFGSLVFLFAPFIFLFVVPYYLTGDLELSRKLTVVIPFFYGIAFIVATTRAFIFKFREREYSDRSKIELVLAAYIALLSWVTLPIIVFFGDYQALEHSVTNSGFLIMTIVYIRSSIYQSRKEYRLLLTTSRRNGQEIDLNAKRFNLTLREIEIVKLISTGLTYRQIGSELNISQKTVARHVSNVFAKVGAANKVEMINRLASAGKDLQNIA